MYKLYYSPGACSLAVHVALQECGVPFEAVNTAIKDGKNKSEEFLKLNPRGQVPVLTDGELVIREGGAILTYLLDKEKSSLLPQTGPARAKTLEWLMWANASLHPVYSRLFWLKRQNLDEGVRDQLLKNVNDQIKTMWDEAEQHLASNAFLAGPNFSVADILMTVVADWNGALPQPIQFGPNVTRVLKATSTRPSYQQAMQTEGGKYKAAA